MWLSKIAELSQMLMFQPMIQFFGYRHKREIQRYERLLDDEMRAILERRLEAGRASDDSSMDICSIAIREIKKEKGTLLLSEEDKVSISHQLKTFYFAGHDTTAILIAWAVWLLSLHDEALAKVRAELRQKGIWTDPSMTPPTFEQLQSCNYLEAVLKETLRLYPPVGGLARCTPDKNETYNGYRIGGADLILSAYVMHHHPSLWKRPEDFIPERFLDGSEERIAEKFLAFSRGPRDCIGKYFALLEAKLAVSALVTAYELECVDPNETFYSQITNLPKHGAQIRFRRRVSM
jgi:cytochrome P450